MTSLKLRLTEYRIENGLFQDADCMRRENWCLSLEECHRFGRYVRGYGMDDAKPEIKTFGPP